MCRHFNSRHLNRLLGSAVVLLALPSCAELPPDYSPRFVEVPIVSPGRPGRVAHHAIVPEACLIPDPTDTQFGPRLPPGCANNANLLVMVEKKRDVIHGRKLGAAPAAPSARAAQRYIYGTRGQLGAGVSPPGTALTPATVSTEPAPAATNR
ncbi:MAG TPA: hypothetical protein VKC66_19565 [Xanthobacteraceae bacterium]|nr:hypothetical protein [Xanthobacteraceae bacterium]